MQLFNYNNKGYCMPIKYAKCEQTASLTHEEFEHTWSCYEGGAEPCGTCGTCIDRRKAFEDNGIYDIG